MNCDKYLPTVFIFITLFIYSEGEKSSCRAANVCCHGEDEECMVSVPPKHPHNKTSATKEEIEPCFCDHGCLEVGDCCPDYKDFCGVLDCQVSAWSSWSECDKECGFGTSYRTRDIIRPEFNGGEKCPILKERKTCKLGDCSLRNRDEIPAIWETAILLPGKYFENKLRRSGRKYDVRSNLKSYRIPIEKDQYCVVFKVARATKSCQKFSDTSILKRDRKVCIVCDGKAQRDHLMGRCTGHGSEDHKTRFKTLLNPKCHGKWSRISLKEGKECPCLQADNHPQFLFV